MSRRRSLEKQPGAGHDCGKPALAEHDHCLERQTCLRSQHSSCFIDGQLGQRSVKASPGRRRSRAASRSFCPATRNDLSFTRRHDPEISSGHTVVDSRRGYASTPTLDALISVMFLPVQVFSSWTGAQASSLADARSVYVSRVRRLQAGTLALHPRGSALVTRLHQ